MNMNLPIEIAEDDSSPARGSPWDLTQIETINRRVGLPLCEAPCGLLKEMV